MLINQSPMNGSFFSSSFSLLCLDVMYDCLVLSESSRADPLVGLQFFPSFFSYFPY